MAAPLTQFQQVLDWIGFTIPAQLASIEVELGNFDTVRDLTYKEIRDLRDSYAKRTVAEGRIHFGMSRTKKLRALASWIRDQGRISQPIDISTFDRDSFIDAITESSDRAEIRRADEETMDSRAKEAAPGNLTGENVWEQWETKLLNMLSILIGVSGVPLVYVIREKEVPEPDETYGSFVEECIAKCSLEGPQFEADARKVHQIIRSYTTGETAEQWIKPHVRKANGRVDMQALRDYYRGEGNQTRRVNDAEKLRDTLHYKGEGAMPFATFLSKCQKMFNMFEESKEPYTDSAKLRFLFEKVQNAELRPAVESLKAGLVSNPNAYDFASASNHLAAQVKPRATRGLSAVGTESSRAEVIKDGKIFTGYYRNWSSLSPENRKIVTAERERLGIKSGKRTGGKNNRKSLNAKVKSLKKKLEVTIASLKRNRDSSSDSDSDSDEEPTSDAGNAFGGRQEKTKSKGKHKRSKK